MTATNNYEKTINANIDAVWAALTSSDAAKVWMKNVTIESDWQENSKIVYTCYDESGKVMSWNNTDMIWAGTIKTLNKPREFTCTYQDSNTGLTKESYFFEHVDDTTTTVRLVQDFVSQEIADSYSEGSEDILRLLKQYLEK